MYRILVCFNIPHLSCVSLFLDSRNQSLYATEFTICLDMTDGLGWFRFMVIGWKGWTVESFIA